MFPGRGSIITWDLWLPGRGTHIIRVFCFPSRELIFLVIVFPYQGDLVGICAFWVGEHI